MQRKAPIRTAVKILFNKRVNNHHLGNCMKLMNDLFFTDYGLMSIIGIAMMIAGSAIALVVLRRKMRQDPPEAQQIRT